MERTILLVDDEENIVRSLQRLLRRDGYGILTANSGSEGLEILKDNHVGVIVSDQRMPEMNGSEFLHRVKDLYPDTIRIVLSGYTELKSVTDAINEGAIYKFLTKPWEDELLRKHIEEAFRQYELTMENARLHDELTCANQKLVAINQVLDQDVKSKNRFAEINMKSLQISQEVLENLPMGIIGYGDDGFIAVANIKAHEILFPEMGILIGMSINKVIPEVILNNITESSQEPASFTVELAGGRRVTVLIGRMDQKTGSKGRIMVITPEIQIEKA